MKIPSGHLQVNRSAAPVKPTYFNLRTAATDVRPGMVIFAYRATQLNMCMPRPNCRPNDNLQHAQSIEGI
ncbi:hypothetical protein D3C85_1646410 [compost metagenome]